MSEVDLHPDVVRAINRVSRSRLGKRFNSYARKTYGISGKTLAARQTAGEFGGRSTKTGHNVVSSAGARGPAQFISSTRDSFIKKYGIDPWKNDKSAIKGLMLHDLNTGVAGYNPGDPGYTKYILGQRVTPEDRKALRAGGKAGNRSAGGGSFKLEGPTRTKVTLGQQYTPGVDNSAEREALKYQLLQGGPLTVSKLLEYKQQKDSLADVPGTTKHGDLKVTRSQGPGLTVPTKGAQHGRSAKGRVKVAPGANRSGVGLATPLVHGLDHLSKVWGSTVHVGTGTNHNQMTTTGNVSDHWDGHGADIPLTGSRLTSRGRMALVAFGMSPAEARKAQGGIYNLQWKGHRVQVIFNTTEGGNHWNHLHVGVR